MPMTSKEMIKHLQRNGFEFVRQNGSHITMRNPKDGTRVVVPYHNKDLKRGTEQRILKEAGLK